MQRMRLIRYFYGDETTPSYGIRIKENNCVLALAGKSKRVKFVNFDGMLDHHHCGISWFDEKKHHTITETNVNMYIGYEDNKISLYNMMYAIGKDRVGIQTVRKYNKYVKDLLPLLVKIAPEYFI